jgi:L-ascorbate metabolism protein UlaG (beta-lactamase superfamily)
MYSDVKKYVLKEDLYFEPLFNHWYVWPHLLTPAQSARHVVNTHKRIMKSFVNNYQLHIIACNESVLTGGEFLDCSEEQVNDIESLISDIDTNCSDLLELSDSISELDELLRGHTSGETLEKLYKNVPSALKGYVELFFDLEHNPSYRFIEGLLYKSRFYRPDLQSVSFGLLSQTKKRPFVLSTPRLPDANHLQMKITFNSSVLKSILESRDLPLSEREIHNLFNEVACVGGLPYMDLFKVKDIDIEYNSVKSGVRLKYLGHAGFLIETEDVSILVDPVIASKDGSNDDQIVSFDDLPSKIDFVCITHTHQDHANLETLLQIRHKVGQILVPKNNGGTLTDPSLKLLLQQFEFSVTEVDELDDINIEGGKITSIPFLGEHGDLNVRSKTGWYFQLGKRKIFLAADSSNLEPCMYTHIQKIIGDVDVLAIGMECIGAPYTWLYGALHSKKVSKKIKESRRLNGSDYKQGIQIVNTFKPNQVYIYALGLEPWYKYFMGTNYDDDTKQIVESDKMVSACRDMGIKSEVLYGTKEVILSNL